MNRFALNDKNNLKLLRAAIEQNMASWAAEVGITIKTGNISYEGDGTGCKIQLKVTAPDETGAVVPQYERDFKKYWRSFAYDGLKEEHLHAVFQTRKGPVELVGLMPNRPKYPFVVKNVGTGKIVLMTTALLPKVNPAGLVMGGNTQ